MVSLLANPFPAPARPTRHRSAPVPVRLLSETLPATTHCTPPPGLQGRALSKVRDALGARGGDAQPDARKIILLRTLLKNQVTTGI